MQRRWKILKHSEEQDQVGSESLMHSRHMRHDRALDEDVVTNDWILERSTAVREDGNDDSKWDLKTEFESSDPALEWSQSESVSESESICGGLKLAEAIFQLESVCQRGCHSGDCGQRPLQGNEI
ncbi:hypothetical protein SLE2022_322410 [Rubroshorea leprosula]